MTARPARVGLIGYMHEVNALAAPVGLGDGEQLTARAGGLGSAFEASPAIRRLRELREVEVVELPVWEFGASGPLTDDAFGTVLEDARHALRAAAPLDAVLMLGHGAGRTTTDLDSDATFLRVIRDEAGDVPVVVVLDFHANVSAAMCDLADVLVGYRTNPHVDIAERSLEAAEHVHALLDGTTTVTARCRPPIVLPQLAQNTLPGEPLADVVALADRARELPIRNISIFGGFSLSDVPDCGVTVCVAAESTAAADAAHVAEHLAQAVWSARPRYRLRATPVADAVEVALRASRGERRPVILADTADNPGGGAPANSTHLLRALVEAGVSNVVMGLHCDGEVVDAAWAAGVGATIDICFNSTSTSPLAERYATSATVRALVDGGYTPTKGVYVGSLRQPGRCCALDLGGVRLAVSTRRVQCADDDTLLHVGLDPAAASVTVVKSRGHFRAGFAHLFGNDDIIEVGAPGVATAELTTVEWQHLPRPVFPLDDVDDWQPLVTLHDARPRR